MDRSQKIIIVGGCGTFGLSTAWHLTKRGYTNVVCVDRWMFPSRSSAGFDRNKIVRTIYSQPLYVKLAQEAVEMWKQPLFRGIFHQTGWVLGTSAPKLDTRLISSSNAISAAGTYDLLIEIHRQHGRTDQIESLPDASAIHQKFPDFFSNTPGFRGIFDRNAGWVDSARALEVVGQECQAAGVKFIVGPEGTVKSILKANVGNRPNQVIGVLMEDGSVLKGDKVILCAGAYTESLIDMEGQVTAVAYSTAHVALTPHEMKRYKDMPVILIEGMGYTFPPDQTGHIKFCDLHIGHPWKHSCLGRSQPVSLPRDKAYHETDTLPDEDAAEVRKFIQYCMPQFSNRPFTKSAMCWDTESFDFGWIVGPHPSSPDSLFLATAGSGHTFKNLPNAGKYVVDCLEGRLSKEHQDAWRQPEHFCKFLGLTAICLIRWRPDKVASAAPLARVDLADLHGWNHDSQDKQHSSIYQPHSKL
ncbi:hypothetical protein O181_063449 [Austropuccinia psidii MF-1]|uniref:FAD dependent oxidoreductase domain-containing protein n=1 Tax=Austropuccinia psidii MF-1 TaxID=1389203 RepID=A0A9Q3I2K7_9BASI|nr:hypothetical protein [Austropuccinia psidii MF-1]